MRFPEVEPDIFSTYVCWIHTNEIDIVSKEGDDQMPTPKYSIDMSRQEYQALALQLVQCSKLADMLQDRTFANAVVDDLIYLINRANRLPAPHVVVAAWQATQPRSGFMRVLVDMIAANTSESTFTTNAPRYPPEFIIEAMKACIRDRSLTPASRGICGRERCFYHDHDEGKGKTAYCGRLAMGRPRKPVEEDTEA